MFYFFFSNLIVWSLILLYPLQHYSLFDTCQHFIHDQAEKKDLLHQFFFFLIKDMPLEIKYINNSSSSLYCNQLHTIHHATILFLACFHEYRCLCKKCMCGLYGVQHPAKVNPRIASIPHFFHRITTKENTSRGLKHNITVSVV